MNNWTVKMQTAGKKAAKCVRRSVKPAIRAGCRVVREYPEVAVFGGLGYAAGKMVDDLPLIGQLTGKNAKWALCAAGAAYGYNKALLRRTLRVAEVKVQAHMEANSHA